MKRIPILTYHSINEPPHNAAMPNMFVGQRDFLIQMAWLHRLGFRGVSLGEAMPLLYGTGNDRVAVLTFDDGYMDTYENALPVLKRFGFTATCFVVSSRIATRNNGGKEQAAETPLAMSSKQIGEWIMAGMEIGSHTATHAVLTDCSLEECEYEIRASKKTLEQMFGVAIDAFCYPCGAYDAEVVSCVQRAGYRCATTTRGGRARPGDDVFRLRRLGVNGGGIWRFLASTFTDYQGWRDKRPI
jgi:peptidoglycan/xylan/chitin deacetylase (PgdA/CDA1 family)